MSNPLVPVGIVTVVIGLLLMIILLPLSLRRVGFNEVAIRYDTVSRKVYPELLSAGLHDIGPSGSLIKFETAKREAKFDGFVALTNDGMEVTLSVSFNYRIVPDDVNKLLTIMSLFGDQDGHEEYINTLCASAIRDVAVQFTASTYYLERENFEEELQRYISQLFVTNNVYAVLDFVQVVNIDLPNSIENAILQTIEAQQDIENAMSERAENVQKATIRVQLARDNADITVLNALRDAGKIDQETEQAVIVERNRMQLRAYAFGNISTGLGRGGDFFVNSYLRNLVLQENGGKTIVGL